MCNIDRATEARLLEMGLNLIVGAIEASARVDNPMPPTDVLATATKAYQQGKISKTQFMAVIDALDESAYTTRAYTESSPNKEYLDAVAYLNQYRR